MLALGIEGTAHTCGVGIIDEEATVLANELDMYRLGREAYIPVKPNHHLTWSSP